MLSKCPHLFLCRSAVISDKNVPTLVSLLKKRNLTVTLSSRVQGMIGIVSMIIRYAITLFSDDVLGIPCRPEIGKSKAKSIPFLPRYLPQPGP